MAYKDKEDARRYTREYRRMQREMWKEHNLCRNCGGEDAYTMAGRYRCAKCTERHNNAKQDLEREREYARNLRRQRREQHLCTECGGPLPEKAYPYVMCERCRAKDRADQERRRREKGIVPRSWYVENNLCVRCGAPRIDGLTAWGGEKIKLCANCYGKTKEASERGRMAYEEKNGTTWGNYQYEYEHRIRHGEKRTGP